MAIPNDFYFILLSSNSPEAKPFSFIHYLAIKACYETNHPRSISFYYDHEPYGLWWDRAKPLLTTVQVTAPNHIFGNSIERPQHMADVLRLQILLERGGIYLDLDVLCVRPFAPLLNFDVVLGQEFGMGLCNAVILAAPGAAFLNRWLSEYKSFSSADWNHHSVRLPWQLARENPGQVHILDHRELFWPMWWKEHLLPFFLLPSAHFSLRSYSVHLWESSTWQYLENLTPAKVYEGENEFCQIAKKYVDPQWISNKDSGPRNRRHITPDGRLILSSDSDSNELIVLDGESALEIRRLKLGSKLGELIVAADSTLAYVGLPDARKVVAIDIHTFEITECLSLGDS